MKARAQIEVPGRISDAEALWYDTARWASFVDGFHHVIEVTPNWPAGGGISWASTPGGRGSVRERVERYEARVGQTALVNDPTLEGTQTVAFAIAGDDRVRITLELQWKLIGQRLGPFGPIVNGVFIRPRQREALARTLNRFARELASDRSIGQ
jgi:hypothetical protein